MRFSSGATPEVTKNNEPVRTLQGWRKGTPLQSKRLNQYVDGFNRTVLRVRPPLPAIIQRPLLVRRMKLVGDHEADHIVCQGTDEKSISEGLFRIAKPTLLRRTPFDNNSRTIVGGIGVITYVYSSNFERTATNSAGDNEDQVIVPAYSTDDIIFAVHGIDNETGVIIEGEEKDLGWLDLNNDARAWAKKAD